VLKGLRVHNESTLLSESILLFSTAAMRFEILILVLLVGFATVNFATAGKVAATISM
jgi:hypothetical protein